jgi:PEP-CTERM motif
MALRFWKFGLAATVTAALGASAHGGLLPLSATVVPDGDNFRYTYGVMLTSNSTLQTGDQFVIYDFTGFKEGSNDQPAGFSFSSIKTGGNPGRTVPNDNPGMPNLVWTYTGDTPLIGQIGLGNFSALSTKPESNVSTDFVSRTHVEDPNGEVREEDNITHTKAPSGTDLPPPVEPPVDPPVDSPPVDSPPVGSPPVDTPSSVPEPSSLVLLALGVPLVAGARMMRNRRKEAVA